MTWPEVSIEDFPPERDDEPSSLRQDILDELTDHFACALNRELLKNPDERLAKERVVTQFGDPIKIARQLWFDAMKEKIMSQRIMIGISAVMAICCIAVVGIAWMLMKESQAFNLQMLAEMQESRKESETNSARDMFDISFQLVQDNKDKKPAVGFTGELTKNWGENDSFTVDAVSDQTGKLDFGKLPWGNYNLYVKAPWGEGTHHRFTALPGRDYLETISCPAAPSKKFPIQFQVNWSDQLKSEDWLLLCDFRIPGGMHYSSREIDGVHWSGPNREIPPPVYLIDKNNQVSLCSLGPQGEFIDLAPDALKEKSSIKILERHKSNGYRLADIYLIQRKDLNKLSSLNSSKSYNAIRLINDKASLLPASLSQKMLRKMLQGMGTLILLPFKKIAADPVESESIVHGLPLLTNTTNGVLLPEMFYYSASKDQPNVWKIKLPELKSLIISEEVEGAEGTGTGLF